MLPFEQKWPFGSTCSGVLEKDVRCTWAGDRKRRQYEDNMNWVSSCMPVIPAFWAQKPKLPRFNIILSYKPSSRLTCVIGDADSQDKETSRKHTRRLRQRQVEIQRDKQTQRHIDRQTHKRQTQRETQRQTKITHTHSESKNTHTQGQ